jgi:peptide/nickel transport system permease protein
VKSIVRFIVRRFLEAVPTLFLLSVLVFAFFKAIPGDFLSEMEMNPTISASTVEKLREDFGLRKPLPVQYAIWVSQLVRGNFGYSFAQRRPAFDLVAERFGFTLLLAGVALLLSLAWSVPLACVSAALIGGWLDRGILAISLVALSLPSVLSAILLFGVAAWSGWSPFIDGNRMWEVWLPALTLAIPSGAVFLRILRLELVDVLAQPFIASAAARGIPRHRIMFQALRNAANPLISISGVTLAGLLSGAVVAEKVFGWPGLGALTVDAILSRDLYVALFAVLTAAIAVLFANLIADIALYLNDPRVRET